MKKRFFRDESGDLKSIYIQSCDDASIDIPVFLSLADDQPPAQDISEIKIILDAEHSDISDITDYTPQRNLYLCFDSRDQELSDGDLNFQGKFGVIFKITQEQYQSMRPLPHGPDYFLVERINDNSTIHAFSPADSEVKSAPETERPSINQLKSRQRKSVKASSTVNVMNLIAEVTKKDFDFDSLEKALKNDPALFIRLNEKLNNACWGHHKISSVKQLLVLAGVNRLKAIIINYLFCDELDVPKHLVDEALIRASMCEALYSRTTSDRSECYLVGLLSNSNQLMQMSYEKIMSLISLDSKIEEAIVNCQGELGVLLSAVICFLSNENNPPESELSEEQMLHAYIYALNQCNDLLLSA